MMGLIWMGVGVFCEEEEVGRVWGLVGGNL